jgi:transcriptional regulator with XRE-family HTH domain
MTHSQQTPQRTRTEASLLEFPASVIADLTGISRSMIIRVINGERLPSLDNAAKIADMVGMDLDSFYKLLKSRQKLFPPYHQKK